MFFFLHVQGTDHCLLLFAAPQRTYLIQLKRLAAFFGGEYACSIINKEKQGDFPMKICGFNKTTLLDYPGRVACTIFLGGCNFRCPFCQNGALVVEPDTQPEYSQEEILAFLKKRKGILDGVCISGGEPTLAPELPEFLGRIRELGYDVKLDTNGSRPSVVKNLAAAGLINKVAMDIKACPSNYHVLTGVHADMDGIRETAGWLLDGHLDYEFRTTVVRELHSEKDFQEISRWLSGAKAYYLQAYRDSDGILMPGFSACSEEEMKNYRDILSQTIPVVEIRGMEL